MGMYVATLLTMVDAFLQLYWGGFPPVEELFKLGEGSLSWRKAFSEQIGRIPITNMCEQGVKWSHIGLCLSLSIEFSSVPAYSCFCVEQ